MRIDHYQVGVIPLTGTAEQWRQWGEGVLCGNQQTNLPPLHSFTGIWPLQMRTDDWDLRRERLLQRRKADAQRERREREQREQNWIEWNEQRKAATAARREEAAALRRQEREAEKRERQRQKDLILHDRQLRYNNPLAIHGCPDAEDICCTIVSDGCRVKHPLPTMDESWGHRAFIAELGVSLA